MGEDGRGTTIEPAAAGCVETKRSEATALRERSDRLKPGSRRLPLKLETRKPKASVESRERSDRKNKRGGTPEGGFPVYLARCPAGRLL